MPRKPLPPPFPPPGPGEDPAGFAVLVPLFFESLRARGFSPFTLKVRGRSLKRFVTWCRDRGISRPLDLTPPLMERYQRWLYHAVLPDGGTLALSSQGTNLTDVRSLFRWLSRRGHLPYDPTCNLELPRQSERLPRATLRVDEAERILAQPDLETPVGIRDRAILEVLYGTGMRRHEIRGLCLYDIDAVKGTVMIREGKGRRDRVVPIGERTLAWLEKYLVEVRPSLAPLEDEGVVFLTREGTPMSLSYIATKVGRYVRASGVDKRGACHLFRHSTATLMLERGADIRYIQELLGHRQLQTTQIYTKVTIAQLKEVYRRTHPAARLGRAKETAEATEDNAEIEEEEPSSS